LTLAGGSEVERTEGFVRWGRLAEALGRLADAQAWADRAVEASRGRWSSILVDALLLSARVSRVRGDWLPAWRAAEEATLLAERDPTGWRRGLAALERGRWHLSRGGLDRATEALQAARAALEEAGDPLGGADALLDLARVAAARSRWGPASVLAQWARARWVRAGCRGAVARAIVFQAAIARCRGEDTSEELEEALEDLRAVGGADVPVGELELARLAAARGGWALARTLAEGALRTWTAHGALPAAAKAHALLAEIAVRLQDVRALDRHLGRLDLLVSTVGVADPDTGALVASVLSVVEPVDPARARLLRERLGGRASAA
jgi:tetratricopeptide (TPR) repeat protein